jgi:hypothetical protein
LTVKCNFDRRDRYYGVFSPDNDKTYLDLYVSWSILLSDFNQMSSVTKIGIEGAELIKADGRTDEHGEANWHFSRVQLCPYPQIQYPRFQLSAVHRGPKKMEK